MKKVKQKVWETKMKALLKRRQEGTGDSASSNSLVGDYGRHLRSIVVGDNVLEVAAGDGANRDLAELDGKSYTGIDASPAADHVEDCMAENMSRFDDEQFDTTFCFASLDNLQDPQEALNEMKRVTKGNILFMTGTDIPEDELHTQCITEQELDESMLPWVPAMKNRLEPKILLVEYKPS